MTRYWSVLLLILLFPAYIWAQAQWSGCDFLTPGAGITITCPDMITGGATITNSAGPGPPGPPGPTGPVGGSGAAPQIAVWSGATTLTGFTDFTWDDINGQFLASPSSTIDLTSQSAAIVGSANSSILPGGAVDNANWAFLGGTSVGTILGGFYNAIIGSSCSALGGSPTATGCVPTPTFSSSYSALAGTSFGGIDNSNYSFMGGVSNSQITNGTYAFQGGTSNSTIDGSMGLGDGTNAAIIGDNNSINRGVESVIAGADFTLIDSGSSFSFIGGNADGTIGAGCSGCAILGGDGVTATIGVGVTNAVVISGGIVDGSLNQAVAINGGHATRGNETAIGGSSHTLTVGDVTLGATPFDGSMLFNPGGTLSIGDDSGAVFAFSGSGNLTQTSTLGGATGLVILNGSGDTIVGDSPTGVSIFNGSGTATLGDNAIGTLILNTLGPTTVGNGDEGSIILSSGVTTLGDTSNANIALNAVGTTTYGDNVNAVFTLNMDGIMTIANGVSSTIVIDAGGNIGTVSHSNALLLTAGTSTTQANNSVSIGVSTTPEVTITATKVAMGGATVTTLGSAIFTALGTPANGSMLYCSDCDPTATLLTCTHAGAQTGAFAYRVNGAWKCMG